MPTNNLNIYDSSTNSYILYSKIAATQIPQQDREPVYIGKEANKCIFSTHKYITIYDSATSQFKDISVPKGNIDIATTYNTRLANIKGLVTFSYTDMIMRSAIIMDHELADPKEIMTLSSKPLFMMQHPNDESLFMICYTCGLMQILPTYVLDGDTHVLQELEQWFRFRTYPPEMEGNDMIKVNKNSDLTTIHFNSYEGVSLIFMKQENISSCDTKGCTLLLTHGCQLLQEYNLCTQQVNIITAPYSIAYAKYINTSTIECLTQDHTVLIYNTDASQFIFQIKQMPVLPLLTIFTAYQEFIVPTNGKAYVSQHKRESAFYSINIIGADGKLYHINLTNQTSAEIPSINVMPINIRPVTLFETPIQAAMIVNGDFFIVTESQYIMVFSDKAKPPVPAMLELSKISNAISNSSNEKSPKELASNIKSNSMSPRAIKLYQVKKEAKKKEAKKHAKAKIKHIKGISPPRQESPTNANKLKEQKQFVVPAKEEIIRASIIKKNNETKERNEIIEVKTNYNLSIQNKEAEEYTYEINDNLYKINEEELYMCEDTVKAVKKKRGQSLTLCNSKSILSTNTPLPEELSDKKSRNHIAKLIIPPKKKKDFKKIIDRLEMELNPLFKNKKQLMKKYTDIYKSLSTRPYKRNSIEDEEQMFNIESSLFKCEEDCVEDEKEEDDRKILKTPESSLPPLHYAYSCGRIEEFTRKYKKNRLLIGEDHQDSTINFEQSQITSIASVASETNEYEEALKNLAGTSEINQENITKVLNALSRNNKPHIMKSMKSLSVALSTKDHCVKDLQEKSLKIKYNQKIKELKRGREGKSLVTIDAYARHIPVPLYQATNIVPRTRKNTDI